MILMLIKSPNTGFFPHVTFHDFYAGMLNPYSMAYATYAGLNDFSKLKPLEGETRYFLMVEGDFKRGIITIADKENPDLAIPLDVRLGRKPKIKAHFENGIPVIYVKLNIESDLGAIQSREKL